MATIEKIESLAQGYATSRDVLVKRVQNLEDETRQVKRRLLAGIKTAVASAQEAHDLLKAAIEKSPKLFKRPKTRTLHGVRVGFKKAKGTVSWSDQQQVIKLIRKHLPDQVDVLIKETESPVKNALSALSAAELKKIGVTLSNTGDYVLIKTADSEIDKLVDALLGDDEEIAE